MSNYSSYIYYFAMTAKLRKLTILFLFHKALDMLDSFYDKRIDLTLFFTGYCSDHFRSPHTSALFSGQPIPTLLFQNCPGLDTI